MVNIVLIIGSAPDAVRARDFPREIFSSIVAINNAWAVRPDWDYLIHADDFPGERMPDDHRLRTASIVRSDAFVPAQNALGGFVYAGGTMAFTAGYWALHELKPDVLVFIGCDMIYPANSATHFYGVGTADPLRDDVTLRNLEAKSARLLITALSRGSVCLNLSNLSASRLLLPRTTLAFLKRLTATRVKAVSMMLDAAIDARSSKSAIELENRLAYLVEDGRYWEHVSEFDEASLAEIDQYWHGSCQNLPLSVSPAQGCWRRKDQAEAGRGRRVAAADPD